MIFTGTILNKYSCEYHRCPQCDFLFIPDPSWLKEAYSAAIAATDVGLLSRIQLYFPIIKNFIEENKLFCESSAFLDYGGGYGILTRIMRDQGYNFFHYDKYCENLFARYFDLEHYGHSHNNFSLVTAIEVFEHLDDPLATIQELFSLSDTIFFTTELVGDTVDPNWWYFASETGQHISFFSMRTLAEIGKIFGATCTSFANMHCLTKNDTIKIQHRQNTFRRFFKKPPLFRASLLQDDYLKTKQKTCDAMNR